MMAIGQDSIGQQFVVQPFSDFLITHEQDNRCLNPTAADQISSPHSNSYVDLDGDCMPDIFLQKQKRLSNPDSSIYYYNYFEVYTQKIF